MYVHEGNSHQYVTPGENVAFHDLLQALPLGAVVTDLLGNVLAYNRKLLNDWGPGTELQEQMREGVNWVELSQVAGFPTSQAVRRRSLLVSVAEASAVVTLRSGVTLAEHSKPIFVGEACVGRLWSYQPQAPASQDELCGLSLREVTDLLPQPVFIGERSDVNLYFNQSWLDYTGLSQTESRGHGWIKAVHAEDQATCIQAISQGQSYEIKCRLQRFDGVYRWFAVRAQPLRAKECEAQLWLGTCTDIHDEKALLEELELCVEERSKALQEALSEAEQEGRAKNDFLSRMSQELRAPLNAILSFGQLLEMEDLEPDVLESVQPIVKSGRYLLRLVDEVGDLVKIETGSEELELDVVDAQSTIFDSLEIVRSQAAERHIEVHYTPCLPSNAFVQANRRRLQQVLVNLMTNAVKYNREGGHMWISCEQDGQGHVRLLVRDTGQGLSNEQLGKLFCPFERLGAVRNGVEGLGLGLAFAKRLVNAMGGRIQVQSELGVGSTFTVELPEATADEKQDRASEPDAQSMAPQRVKVLAVTDSPLYRDVFAAMLRPRHELVLAFADGLEKALSADKPDLLLLDMDLDDADPSHVNQFNRAFPQCPLVALSSTRRHHQAFQEADPFFAWSSKSLDPVEFLRTVDQALVHRFQAE